MIERAAGAAGAAAAVGAATATAAAAHCNATEAPTGYLQSLPLSPLPPHVFPPRNQ